MDHLDDIDKDSLLEEGHDWIDLLILQDANNLRSRTTGISATTPTAESFRRGAAPASLACQYSTIRN
jgi:hypothetical protein